MSILSSLLLLVVLVLSTCNNIVQATWFPQLDPIAPDQWSTIMQNYDIKSSYGTCKELSSGHTGFVRVFNDRPATIVLSVGASGNGGGSFDVKFKDSLYIFDQQIDFKEYPCIVVPPYQPVEWLSIGFSSDVTICSYEGMDFKFLFFFEVHIISLLRK